MDTNLTAHYLAIETERAQVLAQAARGRLVKQAIATRPKHTRTLTEHRRVGVMLSAMVLRRLLAVRQLLTVHTARQSG